MSLWIPLFVDFVTHPKTARLRRLLKLATAEAYVIRLWLWCAVHFPDGRPDLELAEEVLGWKPADGRLVAALKEAGFVDPDGLLHGWEGRAGSTLSRIESQRRHARDRKARSRVSRVTDASRHGDVTRDSGVQKEKEKEKEKEIGAKAPSSSPAGEAEGQPAGLFDREEKPATSLRFDDKAWRKHVGAEVQELIDTLRREVLRASPETIFRAPEKQEVIAGNRLVSLVRAEKFTKTRMLFLLHSVPASDFWRGKVFTLATVEKNLNQMVAQTAKDWETWKDDPNPLAVFSWQ